MVKSKVLAVILLALLVVATASVWSIISNRQGAAKERQTFFGSKKYPTSGGEKMKVEW